MHRKLTTEQIRKACEEVLIRSEQPSVRGVMAELRRQYGAAGRTERVAQILRDVTAVRAMQSPVGGASHVALLQQQLLEAERRASRAEELERRHQDFWAARYQEKLEELRGRAAASAPTGVSSEQYLRLYQKAAELARRLAQYEEVEPLLMPGRSSHS